MHQRTIDIILFKTYAELKTEAQRTYAGVLWWVLEPILFMLVFYFVFGVLFQRAEEGFVPFLLIGLVLWHWIQSTVMQSASSITANRPVLQQVAVPKIVFPAVVILTNTCKFLAVATLLLSFLWLYGVPPSASWLKAVPVLMNTLLLITAISFLVAAVTPLIPDLRIVIDNGMRALMFLSGVFYDISRLGNSFSELLRLNPVALLIEDLRAVLMYGGDPNWSRQLYALVASLILTYVGVKLLQFFSKLYAKIPV